MRQIMFVMIAWCANIAFAQHWNFEQLPKLPDEHGFAGPFVGVSGKTLLVAGGANFPEKKPWEGGAKVWTDRVFALDSLQGPWREAGRLPRPLGYGVSITLHESLGGGLLCIGGSDADRHYSECRLLQIVNEKLRMRDYPALPTPCANLCGALVGTKIYIAGGLAEPNATKTEHTFWSLDLNHLEAGWREQEPWPGPPRMLAVAANVENEFYLMSGCDLSPDSQGKPQRTYLTDAYTFSPQRGWRKIADMPRAAVAAPSPTPISSAGELLILGGDDGSLVNFEPKSAHPGFAATLLKYNPTQNRWTELGKAPFSRVTTSTTSWQGRTVIPTGEVRPGVRSPEVWSMIEASK